MHDLTVHVVRFYVPALGAVALLGAWLLTRLPLPVTFAGLTSFACLAVIHFQASPTTAAPAGLVAVPCPAARHRSG